PLTLPRRLLCSPRPTPSRFPTCLARGSALLIRTAEQSTRIWYGQALAWSLVLTADIRSVSLLWLRENKRGWPRKGLRPRAGWLEKEATGFPPARADSRLQALPVIVFILRLRPLRD